MHAPGLPPLKSARARTGGFWRYAIAGVAALCGAAIVLPAPAAPPTGPPPAPAKHAEPARPAPAVDLVALGRAIFFDTNLSDPPGTSCASCHDPARAFSGYNGSAIGVPRGSRPSHFGRRNTPSLLYLRYTPEFHYYQDEDAVRPAPFGGLFWNGRVDSIRDLIRQPLLNPDEMNNASAKVVVGKMHSASYGDAFRSAVGAPAADPDAAMRVAGDAVQAFLTSDEMAPFTSKFDAFVTGRGKLTPYEMQGMRLFRDPAKGGCIACHRFYETGSDPALSMFTDYGYDALAVPRNDKLPRTRSPDLGLCERTDKRTPSNGSEFCASFRTPSLRNVAVRGSYMHNGAFTNLRDVVAFYATRATDPKRWYKTGIKFEDVPAKYRPQVNISSIPYNRREGDVPALNDAEIDAIVVFLNTLTDAKYVAVVPR